MGILRGMGRLVDVADLVDSSEVAVLLGLASRKVVHANRREAAGWWALFPVPVIERSQVTFWLRSEVVAWDVERRANPRPKGPKPNTARR